MKTEVKKLAPGERWSKLFAHFRRGKCWFFDDGVFGHIDDQHKMHESSAIFYRDDPPTLELYAIEGGKEVAVQIFPSLEQMKNLRDFLIIECDALDRMEAGGFADLNVEDRSEN